MDQDGAQFTRRFRHDAWRQGIDRPRQVRIRFRPIDIRIGGGIDDQAGLRLAQSFLYGIQVAKV